ncbi:MAG TPA: response regulator [Geobacteraceae bacterium]|nr:response regulator [Geobacteraceae bacterium]
MKPPGSDRLENFRVLLVEDNPDDEFLAMWVLKKVGLDKVSVARDGREALDLLCNGEEGADAVPDLVILDLRLPRIDGKEVLRRIRADARTMNLPVLILTSSEDLGDRDSCRRLGIIDYCHKPLKDADLLKILNLV